MRLQVIILFLIAFILGNIKPIFAQQPTFGPVCEEAVTCTPTQPPPTSTPQPTSTTQPTSTPKPPPPTGNTESTVALLVFGGIFLSAGAVSYFSLNFNRR